MHQVFLLYLLFASLTLVAKVSLSFSSPVFFVGSRMTLAGILLTSFYLLRNSVPAGLDIKTVAKMALLGLVNVYLTNMCTFIALEEIDAYKCSFICSFAPFITALMCFLLFGEKLSLKKWAGLLIGFLAIAPFGELSNSLFIFSWSEALMFIGLALNCYGWILLGDLVNGQGLPPVLTNGIAMIFGGFSALMHSYLMEPWDPLPIGEPLSFLGCFFYFLFISNFFCYNFYAKLLKRYSATFLSFAGFMTPFLTAWMASILLHEVISPNFYVSSFLVFIGLMLFYQEELELHNLTTSYSLVASGSRQDGK